MSLSVPNLFPTGEVPDLDYAVAASAGEAFEGLWVLGHGVDAINVAFSELGDERGGEHALKFSGIKGTGVFSSSFEWVQSRVEISRLPSNAGSWCLMGGC